MVPFCVFGCHIAKNLDTLQFIWTFSQYTDINGGWGGSQRINITRGETIASKKKNKFLLIIKKKIQKILPNTGSLCTSQWQCLPFNMIPFLHYRYSDPNHIMCISILCETLLFDSVSLDFFYWTSQPCIKKANPSIRPSKWKISQNTRQIIWKSITITVLPAVTVESTQQPCRINICSEGMSLAMTQSNINKLLRSSTSRWQRANTWAHLTGLNAAKNIITF